MTRAHVATTAATVAALDHIARDLRLDLRPVDDKLLILFDVRHRTATVGATLQSSSGISFALLGKETLVGFAPRPLRIGFVLVTRKRRGLP
jgi:hypothetical protein